jgi:hypothetical protein
VQFPRPPDPDPFFPNQAAASRWESVTQQACGVTPDTVMAMLLVELAQRGANPHAKPLAAVAVESVTTIDLGDIL